MPPDRKRATLHMDRIDKVVTDVRITPIDAPKLPVFKLSATACIANARDTIQYGIS